MGGTSMAVQRWRREPEFYRDRIFVGTVLDVGGGHDAIGRYQGILTGIGDVTVLDCDPPQRTGYHAWVQADAEQVPVGRQWDVVYSSHCLEHVAPWRVAPTVLAWWGAVRPKGHLVIIVPSWEHYERGGWPSRRNADHKSGWVLGNDVPHTEAPIFRLLEVVRPLHGRILRALTLDAGFDRSVWDQTVSGTCESGLELVMQKGEQ